MSNVIAHFNMHGYAGYIISAYAVAGGCLLVHVYNAIRRSRYVRKVISARYRS